MGVMLTSWGSLRSWTRDPPTVGLLGSAVLPSGPPGCFSDFPALLGGSVAPRPCSPCSATVARLQVWVRSVGYQGAGQLLFRPRLAAQALVPGPASSVSINILGSPTHRAMRDQPGASAFFRRNCQPADSFMNIQRVCTTREAQLRGPSGCAK